MVRHLCLVCPAILRAKDSFKTSNDTTIRFFPRISLFDSYKRFDKSLTNIFCHFTYITPMSTFRNTDCQLCSLHLSILIASFCSKALELFIVNITNAFKEQQRKDILFVSSCIYLSTQTSGCTP